MASKSWFLLGIVAAIFCAWLEPSIGNHGGPLRPEYTIKYLAVGIIFFNSGITLRTDELKHALMSARLHLLIQGFSLGIFPVAMTIFVSALRATTDTSPFLSTGLIVVGSMPPPVSSAVILTKAVGGNEAAAIFNSALGSLLGIVVTPILLLQLGGIVSDVPLLHIFMSLVSTVLVPLVLGQLMRHFYWPRIKTLGIPFSDIGSAVLLVIIYSTFCDTFSEAAPVPVADIGLVIFIVVITQLCAMLAIFFLAQMASLTPADTICAVFCASHKSLTLGIPMLKVVFGGQPGLSLISLPLLVYHPTQILLGGLLSPSLQGWMDRAEARMKPLQH